MQIFLSYASEQRDAAEPIAFALRARGHDVFLDRDDLAGGAEYYERIESEIRASDLMVFLVSPQSVTPGRYTLTELEIARQHWRSPNRRLLPVKIAPTDMAAIPAYVRAVSILEPKGSAPAETASAVDRLRGLEYALHVALSLALVGLACGLLSYFSYTPAGHAIRDTTQWGLSFRVPAPEVGFLFGLPIGLGAWLWGVRRWWAFVIPFLVVASCYWATVPQISTYTRYVGSGEPNDPLLQQQKFSEVVEKIKASHALNAAETAVLEEVRQDTIASNIKFKRAGVAWMIGLVLAGGTMVSLALILPAFRSIFRWLVVGGVGGAVSSLVTFFVLSGEVHFSNWQAVGLMTLWLVVFSALVGYWLARGRTSVSG
jgi:hypothetical protein